MSVKKAVADKSAKKATTNKAVSGKGRVKKAVAKKPVAKKATAKTTIHVQDTKTGKLKGSYSNTGKKKKDIPSAQSVTKKAPAFSLGIKPIIPTATSIPTSKKALTVEPNNSNTIERAHQILESLSYHHQAILKPEFFLDYEQPRQFGGLPLFGHKVGHPVDQFANLLARLDGIVLEDLASTIAPKLAGKDTTYQVYLNDIIVLASNRNFSRKIDADKQNEIVEYYNKHGFNDLPRLSYNQLTLDDLTELNKWKLDWSFNFENILPLPMNAKEKNVYLVAIEYASHVDLALRMRQELSPTVYGVVTDLWRKQVGAVSPEDNDIYIGGLPIFLRF